MDPRGTDRPPPSARTAVARITSLAIREGGTLAFREVGPLLACLLALAVISWQDQLVALGTVLPRWRPGGSSVVAVRPSFVVARLKEATKLLAWLMPTIVLWPGVPGDVPAFLLERVAAVQGCQRVGGG